MRVRLTKRTACAVPLLTGLLGLLPVGVTLAESIQEPIDVLIALIEQYDSRYLTQSEQNLMMMPDSSAIWTVEEGMELFHKPGGPNRKSLESCDFGKGPGQLKGAYVEMPRYFSDTGKVMDLESRLIHCMKTIQGYTDDSPEISTRPGSVQMKLQTYIAAQSNGMKWNPPLEHPLERAMHAAGEVLFYRRAGAYDMSCAVCHNSTGKRIRASVLPDKNKPEEWTKAVSWPSLRVGPDQVLGSQHRLLDCVFQMRHAGLKPRSDASIALISYWTAAARGQPAILPDMKR